MTKAIYGDIYIVGGGKTSFNDEIIKDIEDGTLFDVHRFDYETAVCSICGEDIRDECPHLPGKMYE